MIFPWRSIEPDNVGVSIFCPLENSYPSQFEILRLWQKQYGAESKHSDDHSHCTNDNSSSTNDDDGSNTIIDKNNIEKQNSHRDDREDLSAYCAFELD